MDTQDDGLAGARLRMDEAKRRFSEAARAVLDGSSDGALLTRIALSQVECARAELRRLNEETGK